MRKAMLLLAVLGLAGVLWAADPFVGTWKLNVAKSKATDPSVMPKSEVLKTEAVDNGLKDVWDGVDADGKAYHVTWSPKYDAKDYPITGDPTVDTCMLKKTDATTFQFVCKKAGKQAMTGRDTVSKDGKTHTMTFKGINPKGQEYSGTFVYDKQ